MAQGEVASAQKIATWIPMTSEVMAETAMERMSAAIREHSRRAWFPWEFPDRNPMPHLEPFPQVARVQEIRQELAALRSRVRDAWSVLLGRETVSEDDDW